MRMIAFLIGLIALAFYGFSVFDMWATLTGWPPYAEYYPEAMRNWIQNFPMWRKLLWGATAAAGGMGGLILMSRNRLAGVFLVLAVICMGVGFAADLALFDGAAMYGEDGLVASAILIGVALLLAVAGLFIARR